MKILLLLILILAILFIGFREYLSPKAVKHDWHFIDFSNIVLPDSPNYYLSCTDKLCPEGISYAQSPVFPVSIEQLQQAWEEMIKNQSRVSLLGIKNKGKERVYVQLSAWCHFPDFVNVRFSALNAHQSTLAVFSQSRFGYSDFGVNKKRVMSWLSTLARQTGAGAKHD